MIPFQRRQLSARGARFLLLASLSIAAHGCAATEPPGSDPSRGGAAGGTDNPPRQPSAGIGNTDNPASIPTAGNASTVNGGAVVDAGPDNDDCNQVELQFAPRVPSVFILVDRSSSMFERNLWNPLKTGVLAVVEQLDDTIRFGFSSYTGARGMQCPELTSVAPIAADNFAAIQRAYDSVTMPQFKGETPTSLAISEVTKILQKEPPDNPKYILLVTDGEPDFCDDPNVTCARDAVVASVQAAYGQGVGTFIFSIGGQVDRMHLGDVASAGVGMPVVDRNMAVHNQCPNAAASYSATSGNAPFFEPDVSDQKALVAALSSAIAGARSCVFDLQGRVKIELSMADQGVVELDGMRLAYGAADGFRMNSETQLELLGAACTRLKQPDAQRVFIDYPCKAIELF